jgi:hypothetical protein
MFDVKTQPLGLKNAWNFFAPFCVWIDEILSGSPLDV